MRDIHRVHSLELVRGEMLTPWQEERLKGMRELLGLYGEQIASIEVRTYSLMPRGDEPNPEPEPEVEEERPQENADSCRAMLRGIPKRLQEIGMSEEQAKDEALAIFVKVANALNVPSSKYHIDDMDDETAKRFANAIAPKIEELVAKNANGAMI